MKVDPNAYKILEAISAEYYGGGELLRGTPPTVARSSEDIARKDDSEKVRLELMSVPAMNEIAKVMTFGAKKYDAHNWRKGFKWSRLLGAALRHIFAYMSGEDKDPESGLSHLAHAGCCIMFLLEHEICGLGEDDRYKTGVSK